MNTNTFYNDYFDLPKPKVNTKTFGGTLGGPILKNKLFYFASWERYDTKRPTTYTYSVPTAKMRAGDFSEVAAAYPTFKLFNPFSDRTGAAREQWTNNRIPTQYLEFDRAGPAEVPAAGEQRQGPQLEPAPRRLHAAPRGVPEARQHRPQDQLPDHADRDGLGQVRVHEEQGLGEQLLPRVRQPSQRQHQGRPGDVRDHLDAQPDDGARRQHRDEPPEPGPVPA